MGMPMIDSNILMMDTEELEQIEDNNKKFLNDTAPHAQNF